MKPPPDLPEGRRAIRDAYAATRDSKEKQVART